MNKERIQLLKRYVEKEPDDPFNLYALAMEYYESDPHESLILLNRLIQDHPNYLPTYFKVAHLLWELECWDEADQTFQDGLALAKKQQDHKAHVELSSAYQNFLFDRE